MPSQLPSRFNNYRGTSDLKLSADIWNSVFGDIAARLIAVEEKATGYDELVAAGVDVAIAKVNDSLQPAVDQITALIQQANAYLSQLQATAGGIKATLVTTDSTHRFITDAQLADVSTIESLSSDVAALKTQIADPAAGRNFFLGTM